ncbi:hypothetical protein [Rheinheimera sp.]|uniref:hypothetical protein n=1 Tax=Rheinheimera sp. TaxID=1869214 RepID=UPI003D29A351
MNRAILFFISLSASLSHADQISVDAPLSEKSKSEIMSLLKNGVSDGTITKLQQSQTVKWLDYVPCVGVDRTLSNTEKSKLSEAIARQMGPEKVEIYESFKNGGWSIIYASAGIGDTPFLFYLGDPTKAVHPVTVWSGAATFFETAEISEWVVSEAKGIPLELANCFAWHVTLGRW